MACGTDIPLLGPEADTLASLYQKRSDKLHCCIVEPLGLDTGEQWAQASLFIDDKE